MAPELFDGSCPSRESDVYALGMVIYEVRCIESPGASPNGSLLQVFAHKRPFSHLPCHAIPVRVHKGDRPSRLTNREFFGLSEDVQMLMERCWNQVPSGRPRAADALAIFETVSRGWVSPTPEAIANLNFGRQINQEPPITEPVDIMLETGFGTTGCGAVGPREAGQAQTRSDGGENIAII